MEQKLKTVNLTVTEKRKKYFTCFLNGKYKCDLIVDENSKDLEEGEHELLVKDVSVHSKYGTKLIFEMAGDKKDSNEIVILKHFKYNCLLVNKCKELGGRWDNYEKTWIFNSFVQDKVEELDEIFNSELINVEIKAKDDIKYGREPVDFAGYTIARATGRDSGATLGDDVSCIDGTYTSGGSVKNWTTHIYKDAIFRLQVPRLVLEKYRSTEEKYWEIKVLGE